MSVEELKSEMSKSSKSTKSDGYKSDVYMDDGRDTLLGVRSKSTSSVGGCGGVGGGVGGCVGGLDGVGGDTKVVELVTVDESIPSNRQVYQIHIDVESMGLYGTAFEVGARILNHERVEVATWRGYTDYRGTLEYGLPVTDPRNRTEWVEANVASVKLVREHDHKLVLVGLGYNVYPTSRALRDGFWAWYRKWYTTLTGTYSCTIEVVADCAYPVESNFFRACIEDDLAMRNWHGPFPLHEVQTLVAMLMKTRVMLSATPAQCMRFLAHLNRREVGELPEHDPLADARQSGRIYNFCEDVLNGSVTIDLAMF
jgi:hypothetical protein